jgi:hypothetical protein
MPLLHQSHVGVRHTSKRRLLSPTTPGNKTTTPLNPPNAAVSSESPSKPDAPDPLVVQAAEQTAHVINGDDVPLVPNEASQISAVQVARLIMYHTYFDAADTNGRSKAD